MKLFFSYLKTPSGVLKIVETVATIVAMIMLRSGNVTFNNDPNAVLFGFGVLMMALIITPLLTVCYIMGRFEIQKSIFEIVFNFIMTLFLGVPGVVAVNFFKSGHFTPSGIQANSLTMGSFFIIASITYFADGLFAVFLYIK